MEEEKDEYVLRRVAKDWIKEMIIPTVVRVGQENIEQKCYKIVDFLINETWSVGRVVERKVGNMIF